MSPFRVWSFFVGVGVTGSLDSLGPVASPAWHKIPFERSQPGDNYHLFIERANHASFITSGTVLRSQGEPGGAIFDYTNSASLAFWDAHLKGDARESYLQSSALEKSATALPSFLGAESLREPISCRHFFSAGAQPFFHSSCR
jgi:hypothetical protein